MNSVMRAGTVVMSAAVGGVLVSPAVAVADPDSDTQTVVSEAPPVLHNVVYRARIDGVSRGATVTYEAEGDQTLTANPTMVPGRVFEVNTVLPESDVATMKVSVQWPYSANLHCEVLIDDQLAAQADDFVAPRFLPQDPDYAVLTCEAPVAAAVRNAPVEPPVEPAPPAEPPAPVA
ncbi:hypothetical protein [Mycobacterium sp. GA-2829]|uniref:hypothetical protein n=1 Tax=Mycobacterium sp. GA-2829 TaxID=1772283 RepID=UPI000740438D|nr:hypothetical protein [Mycobacterium sp. GA-2829]KUI40377.1 hypothetical protein AU194_13120 [Mycobacterium sp. GA-2829]